MRQIASIQSLRALAALMVVIGHAQTEAAVAAAKHGAGFAPFTLLPWGAGVDLFFVISGFIMVVASERLFGAADGAATFATRRLERIVPLYWLFTTLYVLIQIATHKPFGGVDLVASYLFWPRDVFGDGVLRPLFALGWTLNYEMAFYALFTVAIALPRRLAVASVAAALGLVVLAAAIWAPPAGPLAFWSRPIVLEFALGLGIGLAWREGLRLGVATRVTLAGLGVVLLVADLLGAAHQAVTWITPTDFARVGAWGLPMALLVTAAVTGRTPRGMPCALAGSVALGDASYALYLVHPFVVGTSMRVYSACGLAGHLGYWPFVTLTVVASIAAGLAVHRGFERPVARRLGLRRIDGKAVTAPS